jgi:predicted TIM-barrel fold metal-dependent hydrolase
MTLPGVTRFPPEFAARYRARGYWADRPLIAHFLDAFDQFAGRMAVALHKGNVYWDLSGWAPKHFPASLRTDIRGRLRDKIMFGSDYPSLPLSRLLREWDELGFSGEVMHKVFHANAERVLGLKQP